jgi:hypothetical protein
MGEVLSRHRSKATQRNDWQGNTLIHGFRVGARNDATFFRHSRDLSFVALAKKESGNPVRVALSIIFVQLPCLSWLVQQAHQTAWQR